MCPLPRNDVEWHRQAKEATVAIFQHDYGRETQADHLRLLMLREPRGYPAACCNLILPPAHPEADAGFVIMEQVE